MEEIYVIKVRHDGTGMRNFPSEQRYSASTVGGLAAGHVALGVTCLVLVSLELVIDRTLVLSTFSNTFAATTTCSLSAFVTGVAGLLAWRRWYVDNYILFFLIASISSMITSAACACLVIYVAVMHGLSLHINIAVGVSLELIWNIISIQVAAKGVRATFLQKSEKEEDKTTTETHTNILPDLLLRIGTMNRDERIQRFLESAKQCTHNEKN